MVPRCKTLRQNSLPSPPSNNSYSQREPFEAVATAKPRLSRGSYSHAVISHRAITHSLHSAPALSKGRSRLRQERGGRGGQGGSPRLLQNLLARNSSRSQIEVLEKRQCGLLPRRYPSTKSGSHRLS